MKKKLLVVSLCAIIAIMAIAGSSLAWLKDETGTVVNTFTEGKVDIDLTETTGPNYQMVPSKVISKDPTATVIANSEACWLFVKIEEVNNVDTFLTYDLAEGWTVLKGEFEHDADGDETVIIYRAVSEADAKAGKSYPVLNDDQVVVKDTVEMEDMTDIGTNNPQLKFTAYAIQQLGTGNTAADAWAKANFN